MHLSLRTSTARALAALTALALAAAPALALAAAPAPAGSAAAARPAAILLAPPAFEGVTQEQPRAALEEALRGGLRRAELPVIAVAAACDDPPNCHLEAARAAGAAYVAHAEIRAQARDYAFRVVLIDVATGEATELADACPICGLEEAALVLEALGPRLRLLWETAEAAAAARRLRDAQTARVRAQEEALAAQPRLRITSAPAGARVFLDDAPVGETPLELGVDAGAHVLRVELRRHVAERREINLSPGTSLSVDVTLARGDGRPPPTRRSRALLASGVALGGLGVAGLGAMAAGLAIGADAERDGAAAAESLASMGVGGLALTDALAEHRERGARGNQLALAGGIAGGVLLVGGVVLVALSATRAARRVAVAPLAGRSLLGVGVGGRF